MYQGQMLHGFVTTILRNTCCVRLLHGNFAALSHTGKTSVQVKEDIIISRRAMKE